MYELGPQREQRMTRVIALLKRRTFVIFKARWGDYTCTHIPSKEEEEVVVVAVVVYISEGLWE